ncbi:unnamed protein product [Prorocentrum cordatum]|uniref:Ubiquitin-like domain-containing protein n=1 Tax=Prorocentrum cordatum TaxID=2364126 RepID=A0ABN9T391_9DINO|nr:unnamed protein product [Polarella glacialis]
MVMLKLLAVNGHSKSDVIEVDSAASGADLLAAIKAKLGWTFTAANYQNEGRARGEPLPLDQPLGDTLKDGATVTAKRDRGARPPAATPARRAAAAPASEGGKPRSRSRSPKSSAPDGGSTRESGAASAAAPAAAAQQAPPRAAAGAPRAAAPRVAAAPPAAAPGVAGGERGAGVGRLREELAQARRKAAAAAAALGVRDRELATVRAELAQARQEAADADAACSKVETRCAGLTTEVARLQGEGEALRGQLSYWRTMYHGGPHVDGVDYPGKKELALQEQVALHAKISALREKNAKLLQENSGPKLTAQACYSCSGRKEQDLARGRGGGGKGRGKHGSAASNAGGAPSCGR